MVSGKQFVSMSNGFAAGRLLSASAGRRLSERLRLPRAALLPHALSQASSRRWWWL